ncbi:MAG: pentapeptide repeat-containing protein, partial [Sedimenticola sp.]|nr:pentapeptide repeat-containing protein [Sedimenticola sp.]
KSKQKLWYVRRDNQVKGPYPCGTVRRFVLLGRIVMEDEVSLDKLGWQKVSEVPDVIPPEIRKALADGDTEQLISSRMREDERNGRERRQSSDDEKFKKRRQGERRQAELEIMQQHREAKTDLLERKQKRPFPVAGFSVVVTVVVLVIGFGFYLGSPESVADPDCHAAPAPGVNWRNCNMDGVQLDAAELDGVLLNNAVVRRAHLTGSKLNSGDLQYVDMSESDLSYVELKQAMLKGATLRRADLSYADMTGADLSFADLTGANLGGAKLDNTNLSHAIWMDGSVCLAESLGRCKTRK